MTGQFVPALVMALSNGLISAIQATPILTADSGTSGVGVGFVPLPAAAPAVASPGTLAVLLEGQLRGVGIAGMKVSQLAQALAQGITAHLLLAVVSSQHPGVGTGAGIGSFIPVLPTYVSQIQAALAAGGIVGQYAPNLGLAVANAITTYLAGIVLTVPIVGPAGPAPGTGAGTGRLV
jgi:hypothetical protein